MSLKKNFFYVVQNYSNFTNKILLLTIILCLLNVSFAKAQQVFVDVTDYMTQATAGQALCTDDGRLCIHTYPNSYGEYTTFYERDGQPLIVDYIARSYGGGANGGSYIGVPRSLDSTGLRCFSDPGQFCTAPPSSSSMPEGIPRSLLLNVVSPQDDDNASSPVDGTPVAQIAGSIDITGMTTFQVNSMDTSNCQQSVLGTVPVDVFAAFLYQYPFGGDVGTQNALVVEEVEYRDYNGQIEPNHIERYYYVNSYGRVRESTANFDHDSQQYSDLRPDGTREGNNTVRRILHSVDELPSEPNNSCPQGTKPLTDP